MHQHGIRAHNYRHGILRPVESLSRAGHVCSGTDPVSCGTFNTVISSHAFRAEQMEGHSLSPVECCTLRGTGLQRV